MLMYLKKLFKTKESFGSRLTELRESLLNKDDGAAVALFLNLPVSEQVRVLDALPGKQQKSLLKIVSQGLDPYVLFYADKSLSLTILSTLGEEYVGKLLLGLDTDDSTKVLDRFTAVVIEEILRKLTDKKRKKDLRILLAYDKNQVGHHVSREYPFLLKKFSVNDARDLVGSSSWTGNIYDLFVVDCRARVLGSVSLEELSTVPGKSSIRSILNKEITPLNHYNTVKDVVAYFESADINTAVVLDDKNLIVGYITRDIINSLKQDASKEALLKQGGVFGISGSGTRLGELFPEIRGRFLWLFVNFLFSAATSLMLMQYEDIIEKITALAIIMPVIVSMSINIATQTGTIILSLLASNNLNRFTLWKHSKKELLITFANTFLFLVIAGVSTQLAYSNLLLTATCCTSLISSMILTTVASIYIPCTLEKFKIDSAIPTGVVLTAVAETISFLTLFSSAKFFLAKMLVVD